MRKWLGGYSLEALSNSAHVIASSRAYGDPLWNARYRAELLALGFDLVPVTRETILGADGPMWAPEPAEDAGEPYPYPCVIAPIGWQPERV